MTGKLMSLRSELHLEDPQNRILWRRDRPMGFYHSTELRCEEEDGFKTRSQLATKFGAKVMDLMMKQGEDLNTSFSMLAMGLYSLVTTELRR